jgi:hypothetical protein
MGRFHLRFLEAVEERRRQVVQVIHANCLHRYIFFLPTRKMVTGHRESKPGGSLSSRPLNGTGLPAPLVKNRLSQVSQVSHGITMVPISLGGFQ